MSRLFVQLYLDQDVSVLVADLVRSRGFFATTTLECGKLGVSDDKQLAYAATNGYELLTHNRDDFARLMDEYFKAGRAHCGIIIAVRRREQEIARRLLAILNTTTADEMDNQIKYI